MTPAWAQPRSPAEQREMELDELAEEVREWREVGGRERAHRVALLCAAAVLSARRSPFWEAASAPEPMPPAAAARWLRLVRGE